MSLANRALPSAQESDTTVKTGKQSFSDVSPSWVTALNEQAAENNNSGRVGVDKRLGPLWHAASLQKEMSKIRLCWLRQQSAQGTSLSESKPLKIRACDDVR